MRRARSDRPATPFHRLASYGGLSRPRLEVLEDRIYPGDTLLGICALGLWPPLNLASTSDSSASQWTPIEDKWQHGRRDVDGADSSRAIFLLRDSETEGDSSSVGVPR